jgi:hypothetical protein
MDRSSTLPPGKSLSQRDQFRLVWAESERPINLDPCRGMVPLTDERFGQQEVGWSIPGPAVVHCAGKT